MAPKSKRSGKTSADVFYDDVSDDGSADDAKTTVNLGDVNSMKRMLDDAVVEVRHVAMAWVQGVWSNARVTSTASYSWIACAETHATSHSRRMPCAHLQSKLVHVPARRHWRRLLAKFTIG